LAKRARLAADLIVAFVLCSSRSIKMTWELAGRADSIYWIRTQQRSEKF